LLHQDEKTRKYLAYAGAGHLPNEDWFHGADTDPPVCGPEIAPEDSAVVEFAITDDGRTAGVAPVWASRPGQTGIAFARAVREWRWRPDAVAKLNSFWRESIRIELRCATRPPPLALEEPFEAATRRWLASRKANLATIPAIVRQVSDELAMEMTIVENLQRADLNPMEQARAYHRLSQDFKLTQEQMAVRTGKERASVANFLRLLRLPEPIQQKVESGDLTFGHARTLLALDSAEAITAAAQKVIALSLSVRQTESYVQGLINPEAKEKKPEKVTQPEDPNVREAQDRLRRTLGLKVRIEDKKGKGRVIIEYSGLEDFDSILTALGGE